MKLCIKIALSFLFFLYAVIVFSQTTFSGKIVDVENRALTNVNVLVQSAIDGKIYAFSSSDKEGVFFIKYEGEKWDKNLVFKLLGFKDKAFSLLNTSSPLQVQMAVSDHVLQEVVIKSKPIMQKKDTTEYLLSAFSDGTEQTIEEVLKKLPGISVDDNGNISFKGKAIEKITLDNADLFDKNYKLASKNIPANYIGKIQAIERYHENKLLKNAEQSDKVILNLDFREDMKMSRPFGQASLGGGFAEKYELDNKLFSMNKKLKLFDIFSFNNSEISAPFSSIENQNSMYQDFENYSNTQVISDLSDFVSQDFKRADTKRIFNSLNL
ncbi:MAG: hypothetical protein LBS08_04345, partial [Candidatus Symbiothrix sp.]|nr:hypothetical protein [Candidatus Symbiothrix sp.]